MNRDDQWAAGRVVVVTGATSGFGAAFARRLTRAGGKVIAVGRRAERLAALAMDCAPGSVLGRAVDLQDPAAPEAILQNLPEPFIAIDGLINNAGINYVKPFLEIDPREWQRVLDVDLNGAFRLTQLCAREMHRAGRGGSIVQIGSVHTHASLAGAAPYDAAKCGVVGFSKAAAVELAASGIRVNILSPGLCGTEIWKDIVAAAPSEKECLAYWNANIPGQRLVTPLEVAKCCIFLLSDDSSCITGANLFADLGMTSLLVSREPYASKNINATES